MAVREMMEEWKTLSIRTWRWKGGLGGGPCSLKSGFSVSWPQKLDLTSIPQGYGVLKETWWKE